MKINELEKSLGISKANIRYYESECLIFPKRNENGYRDYNDEDAELLKKIIVYRKLGIPIAEIKAVLNNEKTLNDAVTLSIKDMEKDIEIRNISIDICNEIIDNKITNNNIDIDYYWDEISDRETTGDEFIDVANIDIAPFKNRRLVKFLIILFVSLFFFGVAYAFVSDVVFVRDDNADYKSIQQEIITSDTIDTVKVNKEHKLIYVFYNNATCINTYDFNGNFKWAISVPFLKDRGYCYFYLENNKIYIDYLDDVFVYNSVDGEYLDRGSADEFGLIEKREHFDELHAIDKNFAQENNIIFDLYNVYRQTDQGKIRIVDKPMYTMLLNNYIGYAVSVIGAIGFAIIEFISKFKIVNSIKLNENEIGKVAKINRSFYLIVIFMFGLYSVLNILFVFLRLESIAVGIFPATALLIASLIIKDITKNRYNKSEYKYTRTALHYLVLGYVVVLVSTFGSILFSSI